MPAPSPARSLADLIDRAAIGDTIYNYATGVDRRDWALYRSIFTDTVDFDFSTWRGVRQAMPADEWVNAARETLACFDATQHNLTNLVISLDGDRATAAVHMVATHYFDGEVQTLGGFYTHGLVRGDDDGWRISACMLVITWETGDRALFDRAAARGPRPRIDVGEQGM